MKVWTTETKPQDDGPVPQNLIDFARSLVDEYGTQQKAAKAIGVTDSVFVDYLKGTIKRPGAKAIANIANLLTERTGEFWTEQKVLCWMWMRPDFNFAGAPGVPSMTQITVAIDDLSDLMKTCENTLANIRASVENWVNSQQNEDKRVCQELAAVLRRLLGDRAINLNSVKGYKKFCEILNIDPADKLAKRLRALVLEEDVVRRSDYAPLSYAIAEVGDRAQVTEVLERCACD